VKNFLLDGIEYSYFDHPKNQTRVNERRVEVPVVRRHVESARGSVLEVGNVLGQYIGRRWTTVDLVEKEAGVVNCDILDWKGGPYDLIVSISTFEHIGRDFGKVPERAIDAVIHCFGLLAPGGRLVFTVPLGYHAILDEWLLQRWGGEKSYLKRVSADNLWRQVEPGDVKGARYGDPFPFANAVLVGQISRRPS
jgi:SAM-dependent methyltransferase